MRGDWRGRGDWVVGGAVGGEYMGEFVLHCEIFLHDCLSLRSEAASDERKRRAVDNSDKNESWRETMDYDDDEQWASSANNGPRQ